MLGLLDRLALSGDAMVIVGTATIGAQPSAGLVTVESVPVRVLPGAGAVRVGFHDG
ncbi:MAG: hypothetical protein ACRDKL_11020 [Solirubrobacteraceae bacterium]